MLLIPTKSYRTRDFIDAAARLGVDAVVGSDQDQVLAQATGHAVTVDFDDLEAGADAIERFAAEHPLDAVVGVDDTAGLLAATAAARLGLPANPPEAVAAAKNKHAFRQRIAAAGLPGPEFRLVPVDGDVAAVAREIAYPCVVKPLTMNMSRGVIRADGQNSFVDAFHRTARILEAPDANVRGEAANHLLVESYVEGTEYALEGLLADGTLHVLALFDKPEPLEGPYFEETIYVTPADVSDARFEAIREAAQKAAAAVGLVDGPTHIDLRVRPDGEVAILEVDARSIGGYCARSLRFGAGIRLEEVILRRALGEPVEGLGRAGAGGVMMIPIPRTGVLEGTDGLDDARSVPGVAEVEITIPAGERVVELPEGGRYLGFIIAHAETPGEVVASLKAAHRSLRFRIG